MQLDFSLQNLTHKIQERLTAKEAQAHPYFAPIRDEATLQQYLAGTTHS
jgi:casein kinase II subunit alpha